MTPTLEKFLWEICQWLYLNGYRTDEAAEAEAVEVETPVAA